jgi:autotransporter-associated beta strand protein
MKLIRILGVGIFLYGAQAHGALRTWDGGGPADDWTTPANWNPNVAPLAGDDLVFDGGLPLINDNDYIAGFEFGSITFSAPGYEITGNDISLTNGVTLLGAIGPISFEPGITMTAGQRITISRVNARFNLLGHLDLNGQNPEFFMAGTFNAVGPVSGSGGFVQSGGTLLFQTNNSCSGTGNIDSGIFLVSGSNPDLNANVNSEFATVGGHGTVRRIISTGGNVAPGGDDPGTLTAAVTTTLDALTMLSIQLNGAGTGSDQLVTGSPSLGNAALDVSIGLPVAVGGEFIIVNVTGGLAGNGIFSGLNEGATFASDNMVFEITYQGGTGNDIVLTAVTQQASGVTRTWDGGGADNLWSTPENWVGDVAPLGGDELEFPAGAAQLANQNDFPDGVGFDRIAISGAGYSLSGNRVALLTGIHAGYAAGTSTVGVDIDAVGFLSIVNFVATLPTLIISGDINLGSHNVSLTCEGPITLSGAISGSGGLFKGKLPALQFAGAEPNSYTGPTTIFGLCELNKPEGELAVPGDLTIGNSLGANSEVRHLATEQISNAATVTVHTSSLLNLDGFDESITTLCLTGGMVNTSSGTLTVSNVITKAAPSPATIVGNLDLGDSGTAEFVIPNGAAVPDLEISGVLSGCSAVMLRKTEAGQLRFSGADPNTFAGWVFVWHGTLELAKTAGVPSIVGQLSVGNAPLGGDFVRLLSDHQIQDDVRVNVNRSALLDLNGHDEDLSDIVILTTGRISTGAGLLTFTGQLRASSLGPHSEISGHVDLGPAGVRDIIVTTNATLKIDADITGGPGVTLMKSDVGELILCASNTFDGPVHMDEGELTVTIDGALGSSSGDTVLNGGTLFLSNTVVTAESLTVNAGTLRGETISVWSDTVLLNGDVEVVTEIPTTFTFPNVISGAGGFIKNGTGRIRFRGLQANSFTGTTRINDGSLDIYSIGGVVSVPGPLVAGDGIGAPGSVVVLYGGDHQIADNMPVSVNTDAEINVQAWEDTIGTLSGVGEVLLGSGDLTLGGDDGHGEYSGLISGNGPITKTGTGTQVFSGDNTYQGGTFIDGGRLLVNGQQSGGSVFVHAGGTLGGTGHVARIQVQPDGTLSPGQSPGVIHANGIVELQGATATFVVELNGTTAGRGYDQLQTPFAVDVGSGTLNVLPGFTPAANDSFTIINKTAGGTVVGTFDGLPEGAAFTAGGLPFSISYVAGDGNDVVLTRIDIPPTQITGINTGVPGGSELMGMGLPGVAYFLEATTNLIPVADWTVIDTDTADGLGGFEMTDLLSGDFPHRFYRVTSP